MVVASRLHRIADGIYRWTEYSPVHRVELTSHAVRHAGNWILFDPIPVSAEVLDWFPPDGPPAAILLTNTNHVRGSAEWRERFGCPIYAPDPGGFNAELTGVHRWTGPKFPLPGWTAFPLPGGAPGETAYRCLDRDLVVLGDAVVNLPGRALELLPERYCISAPELRSSLTALVGLPFELALLAHGEPLTESAARRIRQLL